MKLLLKYRFCFILLLFLLSSMNGYSVIYKGDQSPSPFIRFLKSLFMGGSSTPTPITIQGGEAGQLYHYNEFNQNTGIVTTHHPAVTNNGGGNSSSMWDFSPSSGSSMSGGASTPSPQASSGLSFQFASNVALGSSGSVSSSGGSSGGGSSAGGNVSSAGGFALFAVGFPQSNLVTAVNGQGNSNTSGNNTGTQGQYDNNPGDPNFGWLPDPSEPMPVGDGTWPMMFFAVGYAARQYRKTKKGKNQSTKL